MGFRFDGYADETRPGPKGADGRTTPAAALPSTDRLSTQNQWPTPPNPRPARRPLQVGVSIARMLTRRYKDSVSDIFVLNANAILRISLFVVCPFLEKKVVDKIHVEVPGKHSGHPR